MAKFKLHIHKYQSIKLTASKTSRVFLFFYYIGLFVLKFFLAFSKFVYGLCLKIKKLCYVIYLNFSKSFSNEWKKTLYYFSIRYKTFLKTSSAYTLLIFAIFSIFSIFVIFSGKFIAVGLEKKDEIIQTSIQGAKYLESAKNSIQNQDFESANNSFLMAYKSFQNGQEKLKQAATDFSKVTNLLPQTHDAGNLLQIASLISTSGKEFVSFYDTLKNLKFSSLGIEGLDQRTWENLNASVNNISQNINQAVEISNEVNPNNLPKSYAEQFFSAQTKLHAVKQTFESFEKMFKILYALHADRKNILLIFQNNNELRTSGGFLGTFGSLILKNGKIDTLHVSSIYDLDGQLSEKISPPTPILNVNSQWFLRDSNWFVNFPQSAKLMSGFYEKEGGETPDVIVALTPDFVQDLLKITGPIELPKYNLILDSDNFFEQIQLASSVGYGAITPGQPKQVLADCIPLIFQKLENLSPENWLTVFEALQRNLNSKNILAYSRIPSIQKTFEDFNWAGKVLSSDRDYLQISTSNLGGTKTDLYIDQKVKLNTSIQKDGQIIEELEISRSNSMPKSYNTFNSSFIRILVPLGSRLVFNSGFDNKVLENQKKYEYKTDPDVYEWEKNSVKDVISGTLIGQEAGKTFFGNWLNVQGGETKVVKLKYILPYNFSDSEIDRYVLMLQKQPGTKVQNFNWTLSFPGRSLVWQNFSFSNLQTNADSVDILLDKDQLFGAVIYKR